MENQTPSDLNFDLNRALLAWKAELAGEPGVSVENVRELEVHLLESIAALKRRGMSDQEAFLKARQQLGSMSKIGVEFAKDNPLRIWRDRVFWAAIAEFLSVVFYVVIAMPTMYLTQWASESVGQWAAVPISLALQFIAVLGAVLLLATGRIQIIYSRVSWVFVSRWRLGVAGLLLTVLVNILSFGVVYSITAGELCLLGFALLMMPREMPATAHVKIEGATDWRNSIRLWRDRLFWIAATQLAIGVWNLVTSIGETLYLHNLSESNRSALPIEVDIILSWVPLIPMAGLAVALFMIRLPWVTRMLQSRSGVLIFGSILILVGFCATFWAYHYSGMVWSPAGVKPNFWYSAVTGLITRAVLIAAMLWLMRPQQQTPAVEVA